MIAPLLLLTLAYVALIGRFAAGLRRVLAEQGSGGEGALPLVSVIVPARNEAGTIERCLRSILGNDYPLNRFEVIVVDDGSTDATARIVRRLRRRFRRRVPSALLGDARASAALRSFPERLRVLEIPDEQRPDGSHKQHALALGVAHARGTIVLTTDADCEVPRRWIRSMTGSFGPGVGLVSGPVAYRPGAGVFSRIQALEFLGLIAVGAAAIGLGRPLLCNGANLAYRRDVFLSLGGYTGLEDPAGDDLLLLRRFAYESPWKVRFCSSREAVVTTAPAPTLGGFLAQRRRWASAGARHPGPSFVILCVILYLFFVGFVAAGLAAIWLPALRLPWVVALVAKTAADAAVLVPAARHFGRSSLLAYLVPAELLHAPYVVLAATLGMVTGYEWRGRQIRPRGQERS